MLRNYPETVIEVLDQDVSYSDGVINAVDAFAASAPWSGSKELRKKKFRRLNRDLAGACGINKPTLAFGNLDGESSRASHYTPQDHRIIMVGKLSVVTFLHEFGHAQGFDEQEACRWSINLFRRLFPQQYSRLIHIGHTLVRAQDVSVSTGIGKVRSTHRLPIYSRSSTKSGAIRKRHSGANRRVHHR